MTTALLIIDVQNDYFPGGKLPLSKVEKALTNINLLETLFQKNHLPVIYIQHLKTSPNADFFKQHTTGAKLHPQLNIKDHSLIVEKHFPNSFYQTHLQQLLNDLNIKNLIIAGMMTHMCVDSTTRAACELGYNPVVISDATATKSLEIFSQTVSADQVSTAFLAALTNFSKVTTTSDYIKSQTLA